MPHKAILPDTYIDFKASTWQHRPNVLVIMLFVLTLWRTFIV
jgi:hypothetical protein